MSDLVAIHQNCDVVVRKNSTGEVKRIRTDLEWFDHSHFFWTEGNFSCDCNRHHVFHWDKEPPRKQEKFKCGHTAYTVIKVIFPDGTEQLIDEEGA